jgi:hypothetical protein
MAEDSSECKINISEQEIIEIYKREREYQRMCFGEYSEIENLNPASFLNFIETYLNKAKEAYSGVWNNELPEWLLSCYEFSDGAAPVKMYEEIIKVMALAGALLETYAVIDPSKWRENPESDIKKWKTRGGIVNE